MVKALCWWTGGLVEIPVLPGFFVCFLFFCFVLFCFVFKFHSTLHALRLGCAALMSQPRALLTPSCPPSNWIARIVACWGGACCLLCGTWRPLDMCFAVGWRTLCCSGWIGGVYLCKICLPLFSCLRVSHSSMQQIVRPLVWAVPHERFMTLLFSQSLYFLSTSILEKHNVKKRIGFFYCPDYPETLETGPSKTCFFCVCCDNSVFSVLQYLLHLPYCFVFIQMKRMTHNIKFDVTFILSLWARRIHQQSKKHNLWHITPFLSCMLTSNYIKYTSSSYSAKNFFTGAVKQLILENRN